MEAQVLRDKKGGAIGLPISSRFESSPWAHHSRGAYLLRTNCTETDPALLRRLGRPFGRLRGLPLSIRSTQLLNLFLQLSHPAR
jgi:hypothetical protein